MDKKTHLLKNQYKSLGLVLVLVFLSTAMHGQTIAQADNTYKQFIMMRSVDSISKDEIYMKSLECARAYKQVLINSPKGVENYDKSCMLLASLFNFLKAGAGYFSQARKDSAAVIFARGSGRLGYDDRDARKESASGSLLPRARLFHRCPHL